KIGERRNDPLTPVRLKVAVHEDQVAYIKERHSELFRGVTIEPTPLRYYNSQALAAQVLGYDGEITAAELKRMRKDGYAAGDVIGQASLQASHDKFLRGAPSMTVLSLGFVGPVQQ